MIKRLKQEIENFQSLIENNQSKIKVEQKENTIEIINHFQYYIKKRYNVEVVVIKIYPELKLDLTNGISFQLKYLKANMRIPIGEKGTLGISSGIESRYNFDESSHLKHLMEMEWFKNIAEFYNDKMEIYHYHKKIIEEYENSPIKDTKRSIRLILHSQKSTLFNIIGRDITQKICRLALKAV